MSCIFTHNYKNTFLHHPICKQAVKYEHSPFYSCHLWAPITFNASEQWINQNHTAVQALGLVIRTVNQPKSHGCTSTWPGDQNSESTSQIQRLYRHVAWWSEQWINQSNHTALQALGLVIGKNPEKVKINIYHFSHVFFGILYWKLLKIWEWMQKY